MIKVKGERLKVKGMIIFLSIFIFQFSLSSCEGTTFQSSVPAYPVHVEINTMTEFVDFLPTNTNAYITVTSEGYKENGKFVKLPTVMDAWGYGGVVAYVSMNGYVAFDMACPYCAGRGTKSPCEIDGIYAVCEHCGEQYEIGSGYAVPQKGISREALRRLGLMISDGRITITQQ